MKQKVDLSAPKKRETKYERCPGCGGLAVPVRSKRTRIMVVNDERMQVTDKKWTFRGVVCIKECGAFIDDKGKFESQLSFFDEK